MSEKVIYMDNSASTRLDERVLEAMKPYYFEKYAVATSEFGYSMGIESKEALEQSREIIASRIKAAPEEIIFTSGSTESSNMALKGVAKKLGVDKGKHIIVSSIEDFPVLNTAKALEREGYEITFLKVGPDGSIDVKELSEALRKDTILVSIQHANQEIGTVQNIGEIAKTCKEKGVLFHTDATHTFTRVPIDVSKLPVDLITMSAHTIHGPGGMGTLFIRKGTPIKKIMDGGFQENNMRAGVQNIPGAVGFARAVELVTDEENVNLAELRDNLIDRILVKVSDTVLNGHRTQRLPQNANISFHYVEGESITLHLDMRGIAVSTGSACFSQSLEASHVIMGIGGNHERAHGSLRFTLGRFNTKHETDEVVKNISEIVGKLRAISTLGKQEEK